jgi:hypothetical protein
MIVQSDAIKVSHLHAEKHGVASMIEYFDVINIGLITYPLHSWNRSMERGKSPTVVLLTFARLWINRQTQRY